MSSFYYYFDFVNDAIYMLWNGFIVRYWICSIPIATFFVKKIIDLIKKVMRK